MKMWYFKDILNTFQIRSKNKLIGENIVTLVHEYCSLTPRYGLLVKALSYRISGAYLYHFHTASYTLSSRLTLRLLLLSREINWSVVKWTKSFSLATWVKFHSMYSIVFCFSCPRSRSSDNSTNLMQLFALRCSMLKRSQARIASSIYSREWRLKLTRFDDLTEKIFAPNAKISGRYSPCCIVNKYYIDSDWSSPCQY